MQKPYIVGITGGSGSGKTFFLKRLVEELNEQICVVSQDDYYRPREAQPKDLNGVENFDTPSSIDADAFLNDLRALCKGSEVRRKEYTFNNPALEPRELVFRPAPLLVVEGIFLLHHPEISALLDLKIFIDAGEVIKLKRRIMRDRVERGYDLEDVLYRYEHHVAPCFEKHLGPFKEDADLIVPNNKNFDKALEVLVQFLRSKTG